MKKIVLDPLNELEYRDTPWDQRVLGINTNEIISIRHTLPETARELIRAFEEVCETQKIGFTVSRIDANEAVLRSVLHGFGYYLAEISYKLSLDLQTFEFASDVKTDVILHVPDKEDEFRQIQEIMKRDFHYGRLLEDPNIDSEKARARSFHWIEDLRRQNREFQVMKRKDEVLGFHIQHVQNDEAEMILTGTSTVASMMALPLWVSILKALKARGVRRARTLISAANVRAVNLYCHLGFNFDQALLGMHRMR